MRILTRYILREVTSHALLGGALFTFILFMRDLGPPSSRSSSATPASFADVHAIIALHCCPTLQGHHPHGRAGRHASRAQPSRRRQRDHRHARPGGGAIDFVRIVSIVSARRAGPRPLQLLYLAPRATQAFWRCRRNPSGHSQRPPSRVQPRVFYEEFSNHVLYVQDVPAAGAVALAARLHGRRERTRRRPTSPPPTSAIVVNGPQTPQTPKPFACISSAVASTTLPPTSRNQYNISTFTTTDRPSRPKPRRRSPRPS